MSSPFVCECLKHLGSKHGFYSWAALPESTWLQNCTLENDQLSLNLLGKCRLLKDKCKQLYLETIWKNNSQMIKSWSVWNKCISGSVLPLEWRLNFWPLLQHSNLRNPSLFPPAWSLALSKNRGLAHWLTSLHLGHSTKPGTRAHCNLGSNGSKTSGLFKFQMNWHEMIMIPSWNQTDDERIEIISIQLSCAVPLGRWSMSSSPDKYPASNDGRRHTPVLYVWVVMLYFGFCCD